jgi:nicotinamide-nucleotide amidase
MWETARGTAAFQAAIEGAPEYRRGMLRLFGIPESEIASSLREAASAGLSLDPLEITTCLRRGEIEVTTRYEPAAEPDYEAFVDFVRERHRKTLFSENGATIDQQVVELLRGRMVAVAESCTGGLMAARLTEQPGSSTYFAGGFAVYSNQAKVSLAGVDATLIERFGAVSEPVAEALADGAARQLDADFGIGITGIAGPDGGTDEKPVGTVCFCVSAPSGQRITRTSRLPGSRPDVRDRATTVALHLLRALLLDDRMAGPDQIRATAADGR